MDQSQKPTRSPCVQRQNQLTRVTTLSRSSSVIFVSDGRHNPLAKMSSDTLTPSGLLLKKSKPLKNGLQDASVSKFVAPQCFSLPDSPTELSDAPQIPV